MNSVNWCLMAVAFALGLLLTLAFMIRRVKREVPIFASGGAATKTVAAGAAGAAAGAGVATLAGGAEADVERPYGEGSVRLAAGALAPSGWTVKGNEDSMLYHTPESPSYDATIAELWFLDEDTAERAGFARWDVDRGGEGATEVIALADTGGDDEGATQVIKLAGTDADGDDGFDAGKTAAIAVGGAAAGVGAAKLIGGAGSDVDDTEFEAPYGDGSARVAKGAAAPSGWLIKGNEDSMLYHTLESPSYKQTIAELWFRDEESAERAGFSRWDVNRGGESATEVIKLAGTGTAAAGLTAATLVGGGAKDAVADEVEDAEPYGDGSARVAKGAAAPSGWLIKGNEDSMLYHTLESPSYKQTIAELWFRDEASAERAGFSRWDINRPAKLVADEVEVEELPPGPHGPGTAAPNADGSGPRGWTVKGNEDSMLYHTTQSPSYKRTIAEVWFRDVESAENAGFNRWDSGKSQRGKR